MPGLGLACYYSLNVLMTPTMTVFLYESVLYPHLLRKGGGGGGGWSRPPMISKTVDSTNFNFGRPLGLSMRSKQLVESII